MKESWYKYHNWCRTCDEWVSKDSMFCPECHFRVRTKPRGEAANRLRDKLVVRY